MDKDDFIFICEKALLKTSRFFGYELRPIIKQELSPIDVFSLAVRDLMSRQPEIFFLQIGAHDGLSFDPIGPFIRKHHWKGLLVEPQQKMFAKLVENYADEKQLLFENSAIAEQDGTLTLYGIAGVPAEDMASMAPSFRRHYITLNGAGLHGKIEATEVPALTLDSLLKKHRIDRVDLLQIDTEGYDFRIIKMIDFSRIKPQIIHFESNYLNHAQMGECSRLLHAQGYSLLTLGVDTIAYLQPEDESSAQRMKSSKVVFT